MFDELCGLVSSRNVVVWFGVNFDLAQMLFEFNQLCFYSTFSVMRF